MDITAGVTAAGHQQDRSILRKGNGAYIGRVHVHVHELQDPGGLFVSQVPAVKSHGVGQEQVRGIPGEKGIVEKVHRAVPGRKLFQGRTAAAPQDCHGRIAPVQIGQEDISFPHPEHLDLLHLFRAFHTADQAAVLHTVQADAFFIRHKETGAIHVDHGSHNGICIRSVLFRRRVRDVQRDREQDLSVLVPFFQGIFHGFLHGAFHGIRIRVFVREFRRGIRPGRVFLLFPLSAVGGQDHIEVSVSVYGCIVNTVIAGIQLLQPEIRSVRLEAAQKAGQVVVFVIGIPVSTHTAVYDPHLAQAEFVIGGEFRGCDDLVCIVGRRFRRGLSGTACLRCPASSACRGGHGQQDCRHNCRNPFLHVIFSCIFCFFSRALRACRS